MLREAPKQSPRPPRQPLTCHIQPQGGLAVGCVLFEDTVISPVIKYGDVVYLHSGLSPSYVVARERGPSPVFLHLLFMHVLPILVHVHSW